VAVSDDIMVRFVEQDMGGNNIWEAYGHFSPTDVHRQVGNIRHPRIIAQLSRACQENSICTPLFLHDIVYIYSKVRL